MSKRKTKTTTPARIEALLAGIAQGRLGIGTLEGRGLDRLDFHEVSALVRRVVPRKGQPYEHRCPEDAYEAAAHAIGELAGGFVLEDVRRAAEITWTEAAVALAFLKERGCVVPVHGRKHAATSDTIFEDAMTEYHALYEEK